MIKNYKGISLVALVITIIILLILAGITISFTVGSNGILTKAKNAKEQTNIAQAKESVELIIANLQADKEGKASLNDLESYATTNSDISYSSTNNEHKIIYKNEYSFSVDDKLKITYTPANNDPTTINKVSTPMIFDTFDRE